jgi:hypothetical protein
MSADASRRRRDYDNRRAHARYRFRGHLRLIVGGMEYHGRANDISLGGLSLEAWFVPASVFSDGVLIRLDGMPALGMRVAWRIGDRFGGPFTGSARRSPEIAALMDRLEVDGVPA